MPTLIYRDIYIYFFGKKPLHIYIYMDLYLSSNIIQCTVGLIFLRMHRLQFSLTIISNMMSCFRPLIASKNRNFVANCQQRTPIKPVVQPTADKAWTLIEW